MKTMKKWAAAIVVLITAFIFLIPFYIMFYLSLSNPGDSIAEEWFPKALAFQNFLEAWKKANMGRAMVNSFIITGGAVLLLVFCAACGGYAAARVKNKINRIIFYIMVLSMMVPGIINTVPLYIMMRRINGINTYWGMIMLLACQSLPFSVFLYESFIRTMNSSLEEAAIMDGCTIMPRLFLSFKINIIILSPLQFPLFFRLTEQIIIFLPQGRQWGSPLLQWFF